MTQIKSVLCPIDLSDNSLSAVELATTMAKKYDAKLNFIYVAPQWLPEEAMFGSQYVRDTLVEDKAAFLKISPADPAVKFEHLFVNGNPGPEIVRAAKSNDLVVISTHGRGGVLRLLMGSVAQYVLRNATCPVITYRASVKKNSKTTPDAVEAEPKHFVTELMRHASPIRAFDEMPDVIAELEKANETGAPVIDEMGCCTGILTQTDIDKYRDLQQRFADRDETVVDEIFETDEFGQRRAGNCDFHQVHRHMTSSAITISNAQSCGKARELFESNQGIHHLVVVDEKKRPIGILKSVDLVDCKSIAPGA